MPDGARPEPPFVAVAGTGPLVREVLAGLEEEGVPALAVGTLPGDAPTAGEQAARRAPLQVGVAVEAERLCLAHAKFPPGHLVQDQRGATAADARRLGHNAARIVVSVPLRPAASAADSADPAAGGA